MRTTLKVWFHSCLESKICVFKTLGSHKLFGITLRCFCTLYQYFCNSRPKVLVHRVLSASKQMFQIFDQTASKQQLISKLNNSANAIKTLKLCNLRWRSFSEGGKETLTLDVGFSRLSKRRQAFFPFVLYQFYSVVFSVTLAVYHRLDAIGVQFFQVICFVSWIKL